MGLQKYFGTYVHNIALSNVDNRPAWILLFRFYLNIYYLCLTVSNHVGSKTN